MKWVCKKKTKVDTLLSNNVSPVVRGFEQGLEIDF
jgi:hypothetical protein